MSNIKRAATQMANERLATSLDALRRATAEDKHRVLKSESLRRTDRERLLRAGFLREIIKGWLMVTRPDELPGESTTWYAAFWDFCKFYFPHRFGNAWIISPETSLALHVGDKAVPRQLIAHSPRGANHNIDLLYGTSIYDLKRLVDPDALTSVDGLNVYRLANALCLVAPSYFQQRRNTAAAALGAVRNADEILRPLLAGGHVRAAGRLAGGFRVVGRGQIADRILAGMRSLHHDVREENPFDAPVPVQLGSRSVPPVATRIKMMWADMQAGVIESFPQPSQPPADPAAYLSQVDQKYVSDAYNSLSIEGYQVGAELIRKVGSGNWRPDLLETDKEQHNALAARGYWECFQVVRRSVERILKGADAASVVETDHQEWFRKFFQPSVTAGLIKPERLAGYRAYPVYIRNSRHVPVNSDMVPDAMETFFACLREEKDARVRAVLGHFVFVFIHPYTDGNGRCARFIMNALLASGGYPWTVIPNARRDEYMKALEDASVGGDIRPFAKFVASCVSADPSTKTDAAPGDREDDSAKPQSLRP